MDIYIMDEPSADLDGDQWVETALVLKRFILYTKKAVFVVEHDIMMALYLTDQVVVFFQNSLQGL